MLLSTVIRCYKIVSSAAFLFDIFKGTYSAGPVHSRMKSNNNNNNNKNLPIAKNQSVSKTFCAVM